ncbi:MAG: hypothetical protein JWM27_3987 [Gemmatimonadetes bacterium]|nr:hypothetical protein [Gemmatimonadota bacterium]
MLRIRTDFAACAALLLSGAARLDAQSVHGQVVEAQGGRPVAGALVVLLDDGGHQRGGVLSDAAGRFAMDAPAAGRYRLRAERVGRASTVSEPLDLRAGDAREVRLAAGGALVELQGITVEGAVKKCARPGATVQTATLWEEARKAFAAADWAENTAFRFQVAQYARSLEPGSLRVRSEERKARSATAPSPFASLSPDSLSRLGYVVRQPDGALYYGPDVRVLASPQFVEEHCFRVTAAGPEQPGMVGLAFEPVRDRRLPDIRGTIWMDRASAELRYVEYGYANLPTRVPVGDLGGRVEFERLPDGAWIVRRWRIRTPEIAVARRAAGMSTGGASGGAQVESLAGIHENGGEVTGILTGDGRPLDAPARAAIAGTLTDAATGAPVAGARVYLSGTQYAAVTDGAGGFRIDAVAEGSYAVGYVHPRLDSLPAQPRPQVVAVKPGDEARVALELPPPPRAPPTRPCASRGTPRARPGAPSRCSAWPPPRRGRGAASSTSAPGAGRAST